MNKFPFGAMKSISEFKLSHRLINNICQSNNSTLIPDFNDKRKKNGKKMKVTEDYIH
jgi:hypothetical protein